MSDQQGIKSLKASSLEEIETAVAKGLAPLLGIEPSVNVTGLLEVGEGMSLVEKVKGAQRFRVEFFVTAPTRDPREEEGLRF
ncbi:hypothetical protein [Lysobacter enzymogenes]|uniref:hypothetical protein n=1 Tax=Lysobacter enzymogenes TaxID=69 RepID=UPI00099D041B|nr:hypothetical protein [Lysobacter enzymogenes]UZW62854.1 hypothetical protein BV903_011385 [Lysobacter enzymogenes]